MKFNIDKCKVIHIGHKNIDYSYQINVHVLQEVESKNDLDVIISNDLKVLDQCTSKQSPGFDRQKYSLQATDMVLKLFKSLVRPHVEYCTVAWSPHYKKDKQLIEKV